MRRSGAGAQGRRVAAALTLALCVTAPLRLCAQVLDTVPKRPPAVVHYGKWVALAGVVALGAGAKVNNDRAEETYNELQEYCFNSPTSCVVTPGGSYLDPAAEALYEETTRLDRRAGRYLIAAEVTFAVAVAGFVWELVDRRENPPTIPFEPRVEYTPVATKVGLSVRF